MAATYSNRPRSDAQARVEQDCAKLISMKTKKLIEVPERIEPELDAVSKAAKCEPTPEEPAVSRACCGERPLR
ncbi:MAG TPA: hypothetical protein VFQ87_12690, partial [Bradyrhizobium sp.]|nr:hypothetical protein [Bradyrhizobium sp.]